MENAGQILVESLFGFFSLFILTKILGKTQITQLTAFDFIAALVLGELVGNALYDDKVGIFDIFYAIIIWGGLIYITEWITQKFKASRSLLEGSPTLVIHKGKLKKDEMKKSKLDINQLQHLLRSKGAFSIKEVDYALLETDGSLSVLKKSQQQAPTREDFNLKPKNVVLNLTVISDGEVIWDSVRESGHDQAWLDSELKKQNIDSYSQIFFAEWNQEEGLYVLPY